MQPMRAQKKEMRLLSHKLVVCSELCQPWCFRLIGTSVCWNMTPIRVSSRHLAKTGLSLQGSFPDCVSVMTSSDRTAGFTGAS